MGWQCHRTSFFEFGALRCDQEVHRMNPVLVSLLQRSQLETRKELDTLKSIWRNSELQKNIYLRVRRDVYTIQTFHIPRQQYLGRTNLSVLYLSSTNINLTYYYIRLCKQVGTNDGLGTRIPIFGYSSVCAFCALHFEISSNMYAKNLKMKKRALFNLPQSQTRVSGTQIHH